MPTPFVKNTCLGISASLSNILFLHGLGVRLRHRCPLRFYSSIELALQWACHNQASFMDGVLRCVGSASMAARFYRPFRGAGRQRIPLVTCQNCWFPPPAVVTATYPARGHEAHRRACLHVSSSEMWPELVSKASDAKRLDRP